MDINQITPEYLAEEYEKLQKAKIEFYEEREKSGLEYKLFVGCVDPTTTDEELQEYFAPYGPIKQCWVLRRDDISKKSGFVKYYYKHSAENAIAALNGKITDKNQKGTLVVRYANVKLNNTPSTSSSFVVSHPFYVNSPNAMEVSQNPQSQNPQSQLLSTLTRSILTRGPVGANLYVNHLKNGVTDVDLRNLFSTLGTVVSTRVCTGQYGFVSFDNAQSAHRAITHLNGTANLAADGHVLEVAIKKDKDVAPMHLENNLTPPQHNGNSQQMNPNMSYMVMAPQMINTGIPGNNPNNNGVMPINRNFY